MDGASILYFSGAVLMSASVVSIMSLKVLVHLYYIKFPLTGIIGSYCNIFVFANHTGL